MNDEGRAAHEICGCLDGQQCAVQRDVNDYAKRVVEQDAEIVQLRNLLAECFPLVRPGADLSRRMREVLGNSNGA